MNRLRHLHFAPMLSQLQQRAVRSVVSQLAFRSPALTEYIRDQYSSLPGEEGSLLTTPVFEGTFGWQASKLTMNDLRDDLISGHLVDVLGIPSPFTHQLQAWKSILEDKKSVLVSSGTGSGKTECFMVPVLEDLIRQRASTKGTLAGVQALFLYPLNALINSQQERLREWTQNFKGDIRFALYNGETKNNSFDVKEEQSLHPEQLLSRESIRDTPPSILVTNTTMLEYMLVRKTDAPIIEQSKEMLKYIVLDEAHSYVGSEAAELAMLLRRVMQAYGVGPDTKFPVQIIATSATIGEDTPKGNEQLAKFVAELAGVSTDQVKVIRGYREIPSLPAELTVKADSPLQDIDRLSELTADELYLELGQYRLTRGLRKAFVDPSKPAHRLDELMAIARQTVPDITTGQLLQTLDLMTFAKPEKYKDAFVPMRMHAFLRTIAGLWACGNQDCIQKPPSLNHESWPFGQLYDKQRNQCQCGAPVFELLRCSGCGTSYLAAEEINEDGKSWLRPRHLELDEDEFVLDSEAPDSENEEGSAPATFDRLLGNGGDTTKISCDVASFGQFNPEIGDVFSVKIINPKPTSRGSSSAVKRAFRCSCCGEVENSPGQLFRYSRLGGPFFLGDMVPTLLDFSPLPAKAQEREGPFHGRRLLTFTDSRQGTARISTRLQQDSDRSAVRSLVYHELASEFQETVSLTAPQVELLSICVSQFSSLPMTQTLAKALKKALDAVSAGEAIADSDIDILKNIKPMLAVSGVEHAQALDTLLSAGSGPQEEVLDWKRLSQQLTGSIDIADRMRKASNNVSGMGLGKHAFADFCLYTEFGRRPKNAWSLESLGVVGLRYPHIEQISMIPAVWRQLVTDTKVQLPQWKNLLKIIVDFFLRENSAVFYDNEDYLRWMGAKFPPKVVHGPGVEAKEQSRDMLWPQIRQRHYNRVIKLLLAAFPKILPDERYWQDLVNNLMSDAWQAIRPMLREFEGGFQLDIKEQAHFYSPKQVWRCPYTRKALDVTLLGYSPYLPKVIEVVEKAELFEMPQLPMKHWRDSTGAIIPKEQRSAWLEQDETVLNARKNALWPNRNDRLAVKEQWYRLEEHSAQQRPETNKTHEEMFKKGQVNVLNCSTTMEMGVDIGGMSIVAMNNVPPAPANYLQRAGRAGRRGESAAAAVTLCKNTAHGMEVFANPLWPFEITSQPPQVRLDSESIVQRHVNAFALGTYLCQHADDATKLSCEWFFELGGAASQCQRFKLWLTKCAKESETAFSLSLQRIVKGTRLTHLSNQALLSKVVDAIGLAEEHWLVQLKIMLDNRDQLKADNPAYEQTPAGKSVNFQLRDFRGAFLFSKLTSEVFLPGHGFPVGVVSFNYQTAEELEQKRVLRERQKDENSGKENFSRHFEKLPSRDLPTALREYAPGSDVVLGGKVYRSSGVMLGKVMASGVELTDDSQHLPWFWHCRDCGAAATVDTYPKQCSHCGADKIKLDIKRYLQPIGFATDIRYKTHNDVNQPRQSAYKHPRVLIPNAQWMPLPDPTLGRYRFSQRGELFSFSDGELGQGYAVCLSCGRAESQSQAGRSPEMMKNPKREHTHTRLRGGSQQGGDKLCRGHVQNDLWLGYSAKTDVVELQLNDNHGALLHDEITVRSLGIALREGLARFLGVENAEIGVTSQQTTDSHGMAGYSIYLFDQNAGGSGYSVQLLENWRRIFELAAEVLACNCDSACHHCLLGYDSQHFVHLLDHNKAAPFVDVSVQQRLSLESRYQYWGASSTPEALPLMDRLRLKLASGHYSRCTIALAGNVQHWDLARWPLLDDLLQFAVHFNGQVELLLTQTNLSAMDDSVRRQLAGLIALPSNKITAKVTSSPYTHANGQLLVALDDGETLECWGAEADCKREPSSSWGCVVSGVLVAGLLPRDAITISGRKLTLEELTPVIQAGASRIDFTHELDGKAEGFGERFWQLVGKHCPQLMDKLGSDCAIASVEYSDRYLKSPFSVLLLAELVTEIGKLGDASGARLQISANELIGSPTPPTRLHQDWQHEHHRQGVMNQLLEEGYLGPSWQGTIEWTTSNQKVIDHGRELKICFSDGSVGFILFDHGFGYWRCQNRSGFDFSDSLEQQAQRLAAGPIPMFAPDNGLSSYVIAGLDA